MYYHFIIIMQIYWNKYCNNEIIRIYVENMRKESTITERNKKGDLHRGSPVFPREKRPVGSLNGTICFTSSQKLLIPRGGDRKVLFPPIFYSLLYINPIAAEFPA